nr:basic proline-rich protein [uncultured bacterium]
MSFPDRFELLDLVREDGVQTFRARERATGRSVEVHFAPSAEALSGLDGMDRGTHEGKHYVVTTSAAPLDSAGAWRIKPAEQIAKPAPPPSPQPAADAAAGPGDFTRMFQLRQAPEPMVEPVAKPVQASQAAQPGEFTRAFQKPVSAVSAPSSAASGNPQAGEPGEFTRMFQTPAAPVVKAVPVVSEPVPAPPEPASQPMGAESAPPSRTPIAYIVVTVVLLFAIAVFVWMRKLY